jgi:hypothetical protein
MSTKLQNSLRKELVKKLLEHEDNDMKSSVDANMIMIALREYLEAMGALEESGTSPVHHCVPGFSGSVQVSPSSENSQLGV